MNESNATVYEVVNKHTGEVSPVSNYEAGNETVTVHMEDGTPIVFTNLNSQGQLENDTYAIREVGTHSQPDGTGTVNDEGVAVDEDGAPESAGEAETVGDTE